MIFDTLTLIAFLAVITISAFILFSSSNKSGIGNKEGDQINRQKIKGKTTS